MAIPKIETSRLILRPHEAADLDACVAVWQDPIVYRYTIGSASNEGRTWSRITSYRGHWELMGYGYWAVEEKSSGSYIGDMGFGNCVREIQPSLKGTPEMGWMLTTRVHGKGYATEALKAVMSWGEKNLKTNRTVCLIHPENHPSLRVAEKLGYRNPVQIILEGQPSLLFERPFKCL